MSIEKRKLKHTDLEVSRFCFGTMTLGKPLDQAGTNEVIGRCIDAGINFFDTANMYNAGVAETLLGKALKGRRDKVILASKVFYKMGDEPDQQGLSRKAILRAIEESLNRLQTEYLDVYYMHAPDHTVPVEESLETMDSLVRQGKVRYLASSNFAGGKLSRCSGWPSSTAGTRLISPSPCITYWRVASSRSTFPCAVSLAFRLWCTTRSRVDC